MALTITGRCLILGQYPQMLFDSHRWVLDLAALDVKSRRSARTQRGPLSQPPDPLALSIAAAHQIQGISSVVFCCVLLCFVLF